MKLEDGLCMPSTALSMDPSASSDVTEGVAAHGICVNGKGSDQSSPEETLGEVGDEAGAE